MLRSLKTISIRIFVALILFVFALSSSGSKYLVYAAAGDAVWGKSTEAGSLSSSPVLSVVTDAQNNSYKAGYINGTGIVDFGNSVSISGVYAGSNLILIKHNSLGEAQWVRSTESGTTSSSNLGSVVLDSDNNIYATGAMGGAGDINFGNGVTLTNWYAPNGHAFIVKYNSAGLPQWAHMVDSLDSGHSSVYSSLAVDADNNIYTAGRIAYAGIGSSYDFGNGITIAADTYYGGLIVKYNSQGLAQWARSIPVTALSTTDFNSLVLDAESNLFVVGTVTGTGSVNLGNGVTVTASSGESYFENVLLIKYNNLGEAQWARTTGAGTLAASSFNGVDLDSESNIYVTGSIFGTNSYDLGNDIVATGIVSNSLTPILVKYNNLGLAQWVKTLTVSESSSTLFYTVKIDSYDNAYVTGTVGLSGSYSFGNDVNMTMNLGDGETGPFLLRYNSSGIPQYIKYPISGALIDIVFDEIAFDSNNNVIVAGYMYGSEPIGYGNGISVAGGEASSNNFLLLKYEGQAPAATPTPTQAQSSGSGSSPAPDGQRSTTDTPVCSDQRPGKPDLFQVTSQGVSSASVHFAPASDPVSSYFISFAEDSLAEGYSANLDLGHVDGAITYTLELLKPNTTYYVKVKASNGCMSGEWSTTIPFRSSSYTSYFPSSTVSSSFQPSVVLGAVTEEPQTPDVIPTKAMTPKKATSTSPTPTPKPTNPWYVFW